MPIEIICKGCSRKLRVGDEHAGKHARCPQCGEINPITASAAEAVAPRDPPTGPLNPGGASVPQNPFATLPAAPTPAGNAPAASPGSAPFVWAPPAPAASANPFADRSADTKFDDASPVRITPGTSPHRGPLILVFGLLGFFVCLIFSILAWIWGAEDLRKMRRGTMDPSGKSLTQAGMILGMVSCGMAALTVMFFLFILILGVSSR